MNIERMNDSNAPAKVQTYMRVQVCSQCALINGAHIIFDY